MFITSIKRILHWGFINFWRSAVVSLAAVITITATLFVIGAIWLAGAFLNSSLESVKNKVDISVSLKPEATEMQSLELKKSLALLPEVKTVTYSSREQELADFQKRNENNNLIIQSLKEVGNPFGARLNIQAVDPANYETIAKFLENNSAAGENQTIIDQISFKKNVIERLLAIISAAKKLGLAVMAVLLFISLVVTFNTISLAIYISREEISLMKLVGATDNYIRGPFIVEGSIAGLIASLLAIALLYPAVIWTRNATTDLFGGLNLVSYFLNHFAQLFLMLLVIGIVLGITSSYLAIRKHLKM